MNRLHRTGSISTVYYVFCLSRFIQWLVDCYGQLCVLSTGVYLEHCKSLCLHVVQPSPVNHVLTPPLIGLPFFAFDSLE